MVNVRMVIIFHGFDPSGGLFSPSKKITRIFMKTNLTFPSPPTENMGIRLYEPGLQEFPRLMVTAKNVVYDVEHGTYDCFDNIAFTSESQIKRYESFGFVEVDPNSGDVFKY